MLTVEGLAVLGGREAVAGCVQPVVVPAELFHRGQLDDVDVFQGLRRRISSALNSPVLLSARAPSQRLTVGADAGCGAGGRLQLGYGD